MSVKMCFSNVCEKQQSEQEKDAWLQAGSLLVDKS